MEAVTHLEKVIVGEVSAVTHIEKVIAGETSAVTYTEKVITGEAPPITHLQKVIAGEASPVTHLEHVWAGGSPSPTIHEYTGAVPYTFTANGSPLISWRISGNTVQSGTPTPDNPIMPEGCGDLEATGEHAGQYKIPISSANTTTPIYLGEVETERKIKKLVLTGEETWSRQDNCFRMSLSDSSTTEGRIISTHFEYKTAWALVNLTSTGACISATYYGANYKYLMIRCDEIATTTANFKTYLAQQYAAGTPVTVWYVLANEETAVVNEPLMKIGDYADEVSNVATIPTNNGSTTIDVDTTVKPSKIHIKYKGV